MTTKLTVEVEDELALAAQVLAEQFPPRRKLGFVSLGRSTSGRRASEDEEMLAEGFGR